MKNVNNIKKNFGVRAAKKALDMLCASDEPYDSVKFAAETPRTDKAENYQLSHLPKSLTFPRPSSVDVTHRFGKRPGKV